MALLGFWLLLGILLDAIALFAFGDLRKQRWYLWVWIPFLILSIIGSIIVVIGINGVLTAGSGEAGYFSAMGLYLIGASSLPYPVLLLLCLIRRPKSPNPSAEKPAHDQ